MNIIKTAVIGTGYLGKYHVEKLATLPHSKLISICDIDITHTQELCEKYGVLATQHYHELLGKVDAVSIATPTPLHFEIAEFFLKNGIHVFIEKPITTRIDEANKLIALAEKNKLVLQVGHIERFNPVLQLVQPKIHQPRFIEAQRLTEFKLRGSDVSVVLDLMIHDIDIAQSIAQSPVCDIRATGSNVLTPFIDIANARLEFENGCVASITASRINTKNERRLRIFQNDAYFNINLHRNSCRIRRKGDGEMFPGVPTIGYEDIHLEKGDALKEEIQAFLDSIIHQKPAVVTGVAARDALATALKITDIVMQGNAKHA